MAKLNHKKTNIFQKSWANTTRGACPVSRPYIPKNEATYWTDEQNDTARRGFWAEVADEVAGGFLMAFNVH